MENLDQLVQDGLAAVESADSCRHWIRFVLNTLARRV